MSERVGITEKTARLFMHKVREDMKSSENFPMDGLVHVDKFVVGGYEENKLGRSITVRRKRPLLRYNLLQKEK